MICRWQPTLPRIVFFLQFRYPLLVAIIPQALVDFFPADLLTTRTTFLRRFHLGVAAMLAEWMRRRGALIANAVPQSPSVLPPSTSAATRSRFGDLPPDRQLQPADLRRLEIQRRTVAAPSLSPPPSAEAAAPPSGESRRRWLRARLERLLRDCTVP